MDKPKKKVPLIGKLAVKHDYITKAQLKRALQICEEAEQEGRSIALPEVLVRTKIIKPGEMKELHQLKVDFEANYQKQDITEAAPSIPEIKLKDDYEAKHQNTGVGPSISISEDKMKAELLMPDNYGVAVTAETIIDMIREKGITHGIIKESEISGFLNNRGEHGKPKTVARGTPVYPGEPPVIEYYFDAETYRDQALEIGTQVKIKEKIKQPQVEEGDLLLEKNQMIPSDSGVSVFGENIDVESIEDVVVRAGYGTDLYEKELKIIAAKSGRPFLSVEGRVHVFDDVSISGDYGVASGAVETESSLMVGGVLTGEYQVRGGSISASEIRGADIDVIGDIDVDIGITGSVIRCQGDVRARYIRGSVIESCGSVLVDMEIMDSKIFASGICKSNKSKIIASVISAKRGVEATGIGTLKSIPCEITVGRDFNIDRRIERIDRLIEENDNRRQELETIMAVSKEEQIVINQQIVSKMEYHKQIKNAITTTDNNISVLQLKEVPKQLVKAKKTLNELKHKNLIIVKEIRGISENLKRLSEELAEIPTEIMAINTENTELELDKASLMKWEAGINVNPVLIVKEDAAAGTMVSCGKAFKEFKTKIEKIRVTEKPVPESDPPEWKIDISPL